MNPTPALGAIPRRAALSAVGALALATTLAGCGTEAVGHQHDAAAVHAATAAEPVMAMAHTSASSSTVRLYGTMRALWAQHMEWTWSVVVAFAADSPGLSASIDRLLANQDDLGDAIKPFYGSAAAGQLTSLLRTHITEAVPVLQAAKAGDTEALGKAVDAWYANAEQIADFLAAANPSWPRGEMRQMMRQHISQTITYAAEQLQGQYAASIADYDQAEQHMLEMADMLSAGLVAQFPDRFRG